MPDAPAPVAAQPTPQPVGGAPAAGGALTPQAPGGEIEAAKLDVFHAQKLLERAVAKFGKSEDGDAALKVLSSLIKRFGEYEDLSEEFSPAEMKRMLASLAGPGAAGPGAPPPKPQPQGAPPGAPPTQ